MYGSEGRLKFLSTHTGTHLKGIKVGEKRWEYFPIEAVTQYDELGEDQEDFFRPGRHNRTSTTYRWIDAIRDGNTSISPDLMDGLRAQLVIDAVIKAGKERRWVDVDAA